MAIKEHLLEIVAKAAAVARAGSGEIPPALFDDAQATLSGDGLTELHEALQIDCLGFFSRASVVVGALEGLQTRVVEMMKQDYPGEIPQQRAYPLVDLWGRVVGAKAQLLQLADELTGPHQAAVAPGYTGARMASLFSTSAEILEGLIREFGNRGALSLVADSMDRLMIMIRAEERGELGQKLRAFMNDQPA